MLIKVSSIGDLRSLSRENRQYAELAVAAAQNQGSAVCESEEACDWLERMATELGNETLVVEEINSCREMIQTEVL